MKYSTFESPSTRHITKTFLLSLLLLISLKSFSQSLESDRLALVDLYNSTNGNNWFNRSGWSVPGRTGDNPCGWFGVSCNNGRVVNIALSENNLNGKLPESLTTMNALEYFYFTNNSLSGSIPSSIGNMTMLIGLNIGDNNLTGTIPSSVGNLSHLTNLYLPGNRMSGQIPREIGALTELIALSLDRNQLTGSIPAELGNLSKLRQLIISQNQLSGIIPSELGNLSSVFDLSLGYNQFTGSIPSSIGKMSALSWLNLENNKLSGPIPDLSGIPTSCLVNIQLNYFTFEGMEPNISKLDYYGSQRNFPLTYSGGLLRANVGGSAANNVYEWYKNGERVAINNVTDLFAPTGDGTYKAYVRNSVAQSAVLVSESFIVGADDLESDRNALQAFYISTNGPAWTNQSGWLTPGHVGDNPCGWYGVTCSGGRVTELRMNDNNISGQLPTDIKNLRKLKLLSLTNNSKLSGEIPATIGELNELETLALFSNNLTGILPISLSNLTLLKVLDLGSNQIGGTIPAELQNLSSLETLGLLSNNFSGSIPQGLGELSQLRAFNLSNNLLSGTIPSQLGNLLELRDLAISRNQLTGQIPPELGNLNNLMGLTATDNQLSGSIPSALMNLQKLYVLALDFNALSGAIPTTIGSLSGLQFLVLSNNKLTGALPASLGNLSKLKSAYLDHNMFSGSIPAEFGGLTSIQQLILSFNNLTGAVPGEIDQLVQLTTLSLDNNLLSGTFPALSSITNSAYLSISNNNFTFDGIESNISKLDVYSPQGKIPVVANGETLSVDAGGTLANITYRWFKDTLWVATYSGINTHTMTGEGRYSVKISNSLIPDLVLTSVDYIQSGSLPVQLVNFTARKSGESNLLRWSTTAEINNSGFEIERSADARKFEKIGFMDGKGESKDMETYQFVDEKPLPVSYYRLKQIDFDGKSVNSQIVQVTSDSHDLKLYPNPTKDILTIETSGSGKSIEIYNLKGTKILDRPITNMQTVSTTNWPIGTYIIRNGNKSEKVVVEK